MHVTEEQLNNYISDRMPAAEQVKILEHISGCSFCAGKFASAMQERELMFTPSGLKDSILAKTVYAARTSPGIPHVNIKKRQKEFWMYTAKVAFAVCVTVVMIMMPAFPGMEKGNYKDRNFSLTKEITEEDRRSNSKILDLFRDTSGKISQDLSERLNLNKIINN